jgi:hypothetical protein
MNWPWISRLAYTDMRAERDRLLTLVERLTEREYRLARREAGLPEREPQERPAPIPWDSELEGACQAWGATAGAQQKLARERLASGWSRERVLAALLPDDGDET